MEVSFAANVVFLILFENLLFLLTEADLDMQFQPQFNEDDFTSTTTTGYPRASELCCGPTYHARFERVVTSPKWPAHYPSSCDCQWRFNAEYSNSRLKIHFTNFSTEYCLDFVEIYDGPNTFHPLLARFSGNMTYMQLPPYDECDDDETIISVIRDVASTGNYLTIRFASNPEKNYPGFRAEITATATKDFNASTVLFIIVCVALLWIITVLILTFRKKRRSDRTSRNVTFSGFTHQQRDCTPLQSTYAFDNDAYLGSQQNPTQPPTAQQADQPPLPSYEEALTMRKDTVGMGEPPTTGLPQTLEGANDHQRDNAHIYVTV